MSLTLAEHKLPHAPGKVSDPDEFESTSFLLALSSVISARRKQLGLSQDEVGRRIGASRTYISDIETAYKNRNNITMDSFYRLSKALQRSPGELLQAAAIIEIEFRDPV